MNNLIQHTRTLLLLTAAAAVVQSTHAAPVVWSATNDLSITTNWSAGTSWLGGAVPTADDDVKFYDDGGSTMGAGVTNNVVDASFGGTIGSLHYGNTNNWHTTLIEPGVTLTLTGTNGLTAGTETATPLVNSQQETNTIIGPGAALVINNTNANLTVRQVGTTAINGPLRSTFDMSGLDTFTATLNNVRVGQQISTSLIRATGTLFLAKTNTLELSGVFVVGDTANNAGGQNIVNLGQTNAVYTDTVNIGYSKGNGLVRFNVTMPDPVLYLRGKTATRVAQVNVGDASLLGSSSAATTGVLDLSAGTVDARVSTIYLGRGQPSNTGSGAGTGTLTLNAGTFDADVTEAGYQQNGAAPSIATGTINVGDAATFVVNTSLRLARYLGTGGYPSGTLNVANGTVVVKGNIIAGGGNSTINMVGGSLIATNGGSTIGVPGAPILTFNLADSTLDLAVSPSGPVVVASTLNNGGSVNTINISSLPSILAYPATFPIIQYDALTGDPANIVLGSLPPGAPAFQGYLTNDPGTLMISVVVTDGPPPAKALTWYGTVNGQWDTTTTNWKTNSATAAMAYRQGDFVTFDDNLTGPAAIDLTTTLLPGAVIVNNSLSNYTFAGSGKLSGTASLNKQGSGTLVLANDDENDFSGGISIGAGTLQVGAGGTSGNLPAAGAIANDGSLVFSRSDDLAVGNVISGLGSVAKNGAGTLTLSGASSYASGLNVNSGTVRLGSLTAGGTGPIDVAAQATLVAGAAHANAITLNGSTLGAVAGVPNLAGELTVADGTTNTLYISDPQNQAVNAEMTFNNILHGGGWLNVRSGTNNLNPDAGVGFRLRGINVSDFTGTLNIGHNVKAEIQTSAIGPFSPAGTGKIMLMCGDAALGGSNAAGTTDGGYSEINLRNNNSSGDTIFGNDVELTGSGLAILNPLGSAIAGATTYMGNLKIGGGQEAGVFLNSGNAHVIAFNTVTLTGGIATFSPKIPGFGSPTAVGSDLALGEVSETTAGAGLTMAGLRTLSITGNGTYTGPTTVNSGTLRVSGSLGSTAVTVNSGGTLSGPGLISGPVTVNSGGNLSPGDGLGNLTLGNGLSLAGNVFIEVDKSAFPSNDTVSVVGALNYNGTITATNIGAEPLVVGDQFPVFPAGGSGTLTVQGSPGDGLAWHFDSATGMLSVVAATAPTLNYTVTGGVITFNWEGGARLIWQTNTLAAGLGTNWMDYPDTSNPVNVTNNPAIPNAYFRLQVP